MALIEEIRPDFIYSLHNSGFGGAYFYVSEEAEALYQPFYDLVESQGLHLHLGEPEAVWMTKFADAIFQAPAITQCTTFSRSRALIRARPSPAGPPALTMPGLLRSLLADLRDALLRVCQHPRHVALGRDAPEAIVQGLERVKEGLETLQGCTTRWRMS